MKDYTDKIEKFLRGQMSHEEESDFKNKIRTNASIHFQVRLIVLMLKLFEKKHSKRSG